MEKLDLGTVMSLTGLQTVVAVSNPSIWYFGSEFVEARRHCIFEGVECEVISSLVLKYK